MNLLAIDSSSHPLSASLISLVNFLAITYLSEFYTVCVIKTSLDDNLLNGPVPSVVITVDGNFNETLQTAVDDGCQAFIVSERALFAFLDAFVEIHDISDQRSFNKRLLILMDSHDKPFQDRIAMHPNMVELSNVLLVVPDRVNDSIQFYTTKIFNNGARSTKTVEIEPVYDSDFFPDKFRNMNGIPIHLCTLMYPPYTYYEETVMEKANARYTASFKGDIPLFLDGTEVTMVLEFCRKYNCSVEASFDETFLWGNVYDNHTGVGLFGSIIERRADIAVASFYYALGAYKFATYTQPISVSRATILVPKPRILPPWRTPFLSFTLSLWVAVVAAFCVGVLAVWLIEKVRFNILQPDELPVSFSDSVLTMIGFYMVQTARMRTDLISCVLLFTSLLYAGFMVSNCYSGGLAGVMTIPEHEKPIDTIFDLAESGMPWGAIIDAWVDPIHTATQPHFQMLVKTYRVVSWETLAKHSKMHDMGFVGERTQFNHFVPLDFVDHEASTMLHLLKDDLYWQAAVALVTKTCPFMQKFNDLIMQVQQSGIQNYWELQAANNYLNTSIQNKILNARSTGSEDDVVKLSISHFLGAYMILAAGLGIASLAFMFEISHSRMTSSVSMWKRKNVLWKMFSVHRRK